MTASVREAGDGVPDREGVAESGDALFVGPGEMRARYRAFDWAATPLGPAADWPAALRTAVRLMLAAPVPTSLWCGPSYTLLYNDAYQRILGAKHPRALGRSGAVVWEELWPGLEPRFAQIRAGGEAIFADEALLTMRRLEGGRAEDAWFTYAMTPLTDEAGVCLAVYNVAVEVTERVRAREALEGANALLQEQGLELELANQQLQDNAVELETRTEELQETGAERERLVAALGAERAQLEALIIHMPAPVALLLGPEHRHELVNDAFRRISGGGRDVTGLPVREAFPELAGQGIYELLDRVYDTGEPWAGPEMLVRYDRDGSGIMDAFFDVRFEPVRDADGRVTGIINFAVDVTAQVVARRDMQRLLGESERARSEAEGARARSEAVLASIADAFYLVDREWRFTYVNDAAEPLLQTTREKLLGRTLWEAFPGVVGSDFEGPYREAMATGRTTSAEAYFEPLGTWFDVRTYAWAGGLMVHFRDIGARKAAEVERERLLAERDAERTLLRTVLDQLPLAAFVVEAPSGKVLALNAAVTRVWGEPRPLTDAVDRYSAEWVGYHTDGRRIGSDEWPVARAALYGETIADWMGEIERADGSRGVIEVNAAPVRDAAGKIVAAVAVAADVTARVQAERERERLVRALEVERARLASVFRQAPTFLAVLRGPEHVFELVNEAYLQLVGHRVRVGQSVFEALPEVREQGFFQLLDDVLATGEPFIGRELPVRLARTPGAEPEERYVDFVYMPLVEADGTRSGVIAHGSDVTEQVRARREVERLLAESERARGEAEGARREAERAADRLVRLHRVGIALASASTPEALAAAVVREGAPAVGARVGAVTRLSEDGREFRIIASHGLPDDAAARWGRFPNQPPSPHAEAVATRAPLFIHSADEYERRYPELRDLRKAARAGATAALPLIVGGEPFGVLSFGFAEPQAFAAEDRDFLVTVASQCAQALERARLFEAEREARAEAERANRAKSEFLATMSHELRTPLNAIGGYAELMEMGIRGPVTPMQVEDLRRVQASQRHLLGLVNEVLNYARIETGTVRYDIVDVPLAAVVASVEPLVAPQLAAKGLAFATSECAPSLVARADREKVRQVLLNLLSNAVKFTDAPGRVEVTCEAAGSRVLVRVRDTGIGIVADELERVFEPFVQVNASLTRTHEGTGLGLAISRDLARGMGGDLTAESRMRVGSTFTLTLPRA